MIMIKMEGGRTRLTMAPSAQEAVGSRCKRRQVLAKRTMLAASLCSITHCKASSLKSCSPIQGFKRIGGLGRWGLGE